MELIELKEDWVSELAPLILIEQREINKSIGGRAERERSCFRRQQWMKLINEINWLNSCGGGRKKATSGAPTASGRRQGQQPQTKFSFSRCARRKLVGWLTAWAAFIDSFNLIPLPLIKMNSSILFTCSFIPFNTFPQTTPFPFRLLMKCFHSNVYN